MRIEQDTRLFAALLGGGASVTHAFEKGRKGWLHVARGAAEINGTALKASDGVAIEGEGSVVLGSKETAELLLFEIA